MSTVPEEELRERPAAKYQHKYQQLGYTGYAETPKVVKNLRVAMTRMQNGDESEADEAAAGKRKKIMIFVLLAMGAYYYFSDSSTEEPAPNAAPPAQVAP